MEVSTDRLDEAARYFLAASDEDDPEARNILIRFGVTELDRAATLNSGDVSIGGDWEASPALADTMGVVIDLERARQHLAAAREHEAAARDWPEPTASTLRRLARVYRDRARQARG